MNGQRMCLWSGPAFLVLFGIGFVACARFIPPPGPMLNADEIAAMYREHTSALRLGVVLMLFAAGLMLPWAALISEQMRRIKGCSRALVYTQLISGCAVMLFLALAVLVWGLAAFRPERDPATTLLINDLGWLLLVVPVPPAVLQPIAIGVAILGDRSAQPVFARWGGFLNLWVAFLFAPACTALFFKGGPFAWSGLLPFWIPLAALPAWFIAMYVLLAGALRQEATASPAVVDAPLPI